jgi:hypothetical protein
MSIPHENFTAAVYVTTHDKLEDRIFDSEYWVDLTLIEDEQEFIEACLELHSDEVDPCLIINNSSGIPEELLNPSGWPDARIWGWLRLPKERREFALQFWKNINPEVSLEAVFSLQATCAVDNDMRPI